MRDNIAKNSFCIICTEIFLYTYLICFVLCFSEIEKYANKWTNLLKWVLAQDTIISKLLSRTVSDNDTANERLDLKRNVNNCQGRNRKETRTWMEKEFVGNTWADAAKRSDSACLLMPLEAQRCRLDQGNKTQRILCPMMTVFILCHTDIDTC